MSAPPLTSTGATPTSRIPRLIYLHVGWLNLRNIRTKWAYNHVTRAMKRDPAYARSWQANIAMPIYDEVNAGCVEPGMSYAQANAIADRLMRHLFGVEQATTPGGSQ